MSLIPKVMTVTQVQPFENNEKSDKFGDDSPDSVDQLNDAFRPLKVCLRLSGYYLGESTNRVWFLLEIAYCVFVKMLISVNVIRYTTVFLIDTEFGDSLLGSVAMFMYYSFSAVLTLGMNIPIYKNLSRFIDALKYYKVKHSGTEYIHILRKETKIIFIMSLLVDTAVVVIMAEGIHTLFPSLKRHFSPFQFLKGAAHITFIILHALAMLYTCVTVMAMFVAFITITFCLRKEFRALSSDFKKAVADVDCQFGARFQDLCSKHEKVCALMDIASEMFQGFTAFTYLFGIPIVCCLAFGIIRGSLPVDDAIFNSWNLVNAIAALTCVTVMGSTLNVVAHEPLRYVFRSQWISSSEAIRPKVTRPGPSFTNGFTPGINQDISMFVMRLTSEQIGYSVYGMATIDRSTILMVCGTIITYVVVILQVQPDSFGALDGRNLTDICQAWC